MNVKTDSSISPRQLNRWHAEFARELKRTGIPMHTQLVVRPGIEVFIPMQPGKRPYFVTGGQGDLTDAQLMKFGLPERIGTESV